MGIGTIGAGMIGGTPAERFAAAGHEVADLFHVAYDTMLLMLLRAARTRYGAAIRDALIEIGCDDMPPNGSYVLGAIDRTGVPLSEVIKQLGVSKQAAGQLVDTLDGLMDLWDVGRTEGLVNTRDFL